MPKTRFLLLLCALTFSLYSGAEKPRPSPRPARAAETPLPKPAEETTLPFRYRLATGVGTLILQNNTALQFGSRIGFSPGRSPFFVAGEFFYAVYSPGALLGILGGGWYELVIYGAPRLSLLLGAMGGMGLTSSTPLNNLPSTALAGFFEAAIVRELDDLVSMHGQIRPGLIGGYFAFLVSLGVSFRFL